MLLSRHLIRLAQIMLAMMVLAVSVMAKTGPIYCGKPPNLGVLSDTFSCDADVGFNNVPAFVGGGGYVPPVHADYINYLKYGSSATCPEPCTTRTDLTYPGGGVCRSFAIEENSTPFTGGSPSTVSFRYTGWYFAAQDMFLLCNVECRGPKSMTC